MHTAMPPIITDMITKLLDEKISPNEKNNIAATLEIIGTNCTKAAGSWRDKFSKRESIARVPSHMKKARAKQVRV